MSEKYSTDELVEALEAYGIANAIIKQEEILAIIARLRATDNLKNKSLMKLAADLGVSFSAAKIISDHAREEYDAKITKADVLCEAAVGAGWFIEKFGSHRHLSEYPEECAHCHLLAKLRKAIAGYEGKE
jgi:hypothetical protein